LRARRLSNDDTHPLENDMKLQATFGKSIIAALLAVTTASAFGAESSADNSASDLRIQHDVQAGITRGNNISGEIGVQSRDGIVTLSGYTTTVAEEQRAVRAAERVDGVKEVRNDMRAQLDESF
jgi:osmotically-inducible protein OsmY